MYRPLARVLLLLPPLALAGCDTAPRPIPVSGRVTLDGGAWPRRGMIFFAPIEPAEGFPRRPGAADFDESGAFRATSFKTGDGLYPGKYAVNIECWEVPPSMGAGPPAVSAVPPKYANSSTSGLTVEVPPDAARLDDVRLDVPKGG